METRGSWEESLHQPIWKFEMGADLDVLRKIVKNI